MDGRSLITARTFSQFPDIAPAFPVHWCRELLWQPIENTRSSEAIESLLGENRGNSLYFSLLAGNREAETGSLETAPSSGESAMNCSGRWPSMEPGAGRRVPFG